MPHTKVVSVTSEVNTTTDKDTVKETRSENEVKTEEDSENDENSALKEKLKDEKKGSTLVDNIDISRADVDRALQESRNRVKLYVLCEQRVWDDRGTGHVACVPVPDQQGFVIIVKLEAAATGSEKNVLESKILMDTVYQKQQV
uniref:RanBD1 domain-containing protein n=1 Tax=Heterorhabditis bacteriophora TaxID=37862 RepID=A0A1I7XKR8_HETBA